IEGIGTDTLTIRRVNSLEGVSIRNAADRIEAGTFMIAAAMHPESDVTLTGVDVGDLRHFPKIFQKTGADVTIGDDTIRVKAPEKLNPTEATPPVHPGLPTDLQAQWSTLMPQASGASAVTDTLHYDRFSYVPEAPRLGADMRVVEDTV